MRSIPFALTWEYFRHAGSGMLLVTVTLTALPVALLGLFSLEGPIDPSSEGFRELRITCLLFQAFVGLGAFCAHVPAGRLYALPVSSWTLVLGRMLPGMTAAACCYVLSTSATHLIYPMGRPQLGPALLVATALACVQAALWWSRGSQGMQFLTIGAVGAVLGCWAKSRFGPLFSAPKHDWITVTESEYWTMGLAFLAAIHFAHVGVSQERCGDAFTWRRLSKLVAPIATFWERDESRPEGPGLPRCIFSPAFEA